MYLIIEVTNLFTGQKGAQIIPDNAFNRMVYGGFIVFEGSYEDCEEEMMNY